MNGYIKLYRQFLDWEWYKDPNTSRLFIHCLLKANHEDKKWRGIVIKKGQFATSINHLADETGLSSSMVRTSLKKLKSTENLTSFSQGSYSIITIKNWDLFQDFSKPLTNLSQAFDNKQTLRELKEKEEVLVVEEIQKTQKSSHSEIQDALKDWYGEYKNVHLDVVQLGKLKSQILNDELLNELIEALSGNIAAKKENAPMYDEKYPWMHYVILKRYWQYRKTNPAKFKANVGLLNKNDKQNQDNMLDKALEEIRERNK